MDNVHIKQEPSYFTQSDNEKENDVSNIDVNNQTEIQDQLAAANKKIVELTSEISASKTRKDEQFQHFESELRKANDVMNEWKDKFNVISEERNNLQKRVHQLEKQLSSNTKPSKRPKVSDKKGEYEVGTLLNHKKEKGQMYYLISWKHFDSSHDSWEQEANLNCRALLNRYKKQNSLI